MCAILSFNMSAFSNSFLENNEEKLTNTRKVGNLGESIALDFLIKNGFRVICSNFKAPIGRNRKGVQVFGEIDLIALEQNSLCFIEVKTRSKDNFLSPLTAINLRKQRQIIRTAKFYRKAFNLEDLNFRYDAISIILNGRKSPKIELLRNFWTEQKFRKKFREGNLFF
jgi:putative endonuclease